MQKYKNLTLIGTSHIAIESIKEVESAILGIKPTVIAIELDKKRLPSLFYKRKPKFSDISKIGLSGFIINIIGAWVEKKLGEIVKVKPGSEMKKAVILAKKLNIPLALVDQPIDVTLIKLSKSITAKEKATFILEIMKSIFKKPKLEFDLRKVPQKKVIKKLTGKVKRYYPNVYKVLIEERNHIIAKNLYNLMRANKEVVAVIGAGHEDDVIKIIKKWESSQKKS